MNGNTSFEFKAFLLSANAISFLWTISFLFETNSVQNNVFQKRIMADPFSLWALFAIFKTDLLSFSQIRFLVSQIEPLGPEPEEERLTTDNAITDVEEPNRGERRVRTWDGGEILAMEDVAAEQRRFAPAPQKKQCRRRRTRPRTVGKIHGDDGSSLTRNRHQPRKDTDPRSRRPM